MARVSILTAISSSMAFESLGRGDGDLNTTLILSRIVPSDKLIVLFLSRHHQRATHEAHT